MEWLYILELRDKIYKYTNKMYNSDIASVLSIMNS